MSLKCKISMRKPVLVFGVGGKHPSRIELEIGPGTEQVRSVLNEGNNVELCRIYAF